MNNKLIYLIKRLLINQVREFNRLIKDESRIYEKEVQYLKSIIKDGSVVCDIGANRGDYTYHLSKLVGSKGEVHAFEPGKRAFSYLKEIKKIHKLDNVICNNVALSDKATITNFIVPLVFSRQGHIQNGEPTKKDYAYRGRKHKITTHTLDRYVERFHIEKVDFIKCDVEGHESFVIDGSMNTIIRDNPILLIEISPPHSDAFGVDRNYVFNKLTDIGYKCYSYDYHLDTLIPSVIEDKNTVGVWSSIDGDLTTQNYIFIQHK